MFSNQTFSDQHGEIFPIILIQTEYFCDTVAPPNGAANFGDYIVIPGGVDSSAIKVAGINYIQRNVVIYGKCAFNKNPGCIASVWDGVNSPGLLKISVPTISKYLYLTSHN